MTASTAYEGELGDFFAESSGDLPYNAYIDRPAMLKLAGDVAGLDVLDLGCGAGFYTAALTAAGARVTGVDGSATILEHARRGADFTARLVLHDLEQPLSFADDVSFDLVVMALVYHHVHGRAGLLAEIARVLRPGGRLLLSTTHPSGEHRWLGGSYYDLGRVDAGIGQGRYTINYQRLTLEAILGELLGAGFVLDTLAEPRPVPEYAAIDPERFARLDTNPTILLLGMHTP
jgi:SAM-dependent methyltransferase